MGGRQYPRVEPTRIGGRSAELESVNSNVALQLSAPAKVNLYLVLVGRRPDGYHELETCLHALELADDLTLEVGSGIPPGAVELELDQATATGFEITTGPDNLICRAAIAFSAATGIRDGVRFSVKKRIPAGGGLGGGSSDAAATLRLLNTHFGEPLSASDLHDIAARLGADVPFFLTGGTQIGSGVGDRLDPVPEPPSFHFVLITPPYGSSTAEVYRRCGAAPMQAASLHNDEAATTIPPLNAIWRGDLAVPEGFVNDLEAAAMEAEPRLANLRDRVVESGFPAVRMSGSGSTLFLAFPLESGAVRAREALGFLRGEGVVLLQTKSRSSPRRPEAGPPSHGRTTSGRGG